MTLSITLIIIALVCVTSFLAFNNAELKDRLLFVPYLIKKDKQFYRFLSSGFIHGDYFHLGINMFVLYQFGGYVENAFQSLFGAAGTMYYVTLFLAGVIIAGVPSYFKHQNHSYYRALGASGAVSAVLYSFILMNPMNSLYLMFIPIPIPAVIFGLLYLAYEFYASKRQTGDGIGHDAHFWGAVFGLLFTLALKPSLGPEFIEKIKFGVQSLLG